MSSISLTEFNQNPSRATRLADRGEVIVLRRGRPAYRITRIVSATDPLDELVTGGLVRPPRNTTRTSPRRFPTVTTTVDLASTLEAERTRFDGLA